MPSLQARNARTCARARNHMATGLLDLANDDEESVLKFRDLFQSNFCANWHRVRVSSRVFDDFQYFCWIRRFMHSQGKFSAKYNFSSKTRTSRLFPCIFSQKIDWTGSRALKTGIIIRNQQNGNFSGAAGVMAYLGTPLYNPARGTGPLGASRDEGPHIVDIKSTTESASTDGLFQSEHS